VTTETGGKTNWISVNVGLAVTVYHGPPRDFRAVFAVNISPFWHLLAKTLSALVR
jgi:hypothetical protein